MTDDVAKIAAGAWTPAEWRKWAVEQAVASGSQYPEHHAPAILHYVLGDHLATPGGE